VASAGTLENAFLQYNGFYNHHQAFPVSLTIGAIDVPWTLDEPTGNDKVMFIERSAAQQLANTLGNAGDNRIAVGATSNDNHYFLGTWITGPTTDTVRTFGAAPGNYGPPLAALARGAYQWQWSPEASAHIGANYSYVWNPTTASAAGYTPTLSPSGTSEIGILGTLPGTGTGAIPVKSSQVFGAEAAAQYGNFYAQAEYYHYIVDGTYGAGAAVTGGLPGPSANFDGGYVEASYTFGGRRTYAPKYAAYSGVIPDHPFVLGTNDFGAIELAGRFGIIDANDSALRVLTVAPTSAALHGWRQENFSAELNWYPNTNIRFDLEYEHVIDNQMSLLSGAYTSSNKLDWIGGRTQVVW
jgi:phosphate-selective porin OprO/OprP